MLRWLTSLFHVSRPDRREQVSDAVLGPLRLDGDGQWWEAAVRIGGKAVGFKVGGEAEPSGALLAHAHEIVRSFPVFERMVSEFLAEEARRLEPAAEEIRQLAIEDICLFWPERPDDGMIFFNGPDACRLWRCDYINRRPVGLGFDS
jgi:hypothetical protein